MLSTLRCDGCGCHSPSDASQALKRAHSAVTMQTLNYTAKLGKVRTSLPGKTPLGPIASKPAQLGLTSMSAQARFNQHG